MKNLCTTKQVLWLTFVLTFVLLLPGAVMADTLQFSSTGSSGTDPVLLTSNTSFSVLNNPGNSGSDIAKLLIFFSVPTPLVGQFSTTSANPTLTLIGSFTMTSSGCANVYDCAGNQFFSQTGLNFTGLNDSDSFTNFTGGAVANGLTAPTSYTIYLYSDGSIDNKTSVTFTGLSMPQGTYLDGGGEQADGSQGFTAFTHAGLVTPPLKSPEPASMALLAAGLLGLGGLIRRKK